MQKGLGLHQMAEKLNSKDKQKPLQSSDDCSYHCVDYCYYCCCDLLVFIVTRTALDAQAADLDPDEKYIMKNADGTCSATANTILTDLPVAVQGRDPAASRRVVRVHISFHDKDQMTITTSDSSKDGACYHTLARMCQLYTNRSSSTGPQSRAVPWSGFGPALYHSRSIWGTRPLPDCCHIPGASASVPINMDPEGGGLWTHTICTLSSVLSFWQLSLLRRS